MRIGTLVRGDTNEMMGVVTTGGNLFVIVYWFDLEAHSTVWIRTDELEVVCN